MAKKKGGFSFKGKVGRDVAVKESQANSYGYLNIPRKVSVYKEEPDSRVRFDIIPYIITDSKHPDKLEADGVAMEGDPWYKRPFKVHRNIGPGRGQTVVCPTSIGKKCPICEYRTKLFAEGDKEEAKTYNVSKRVLYNIIPLEHTKIEEKPHIWDISEAMFQKLLGEELKEKEWAEEFPSLADGYTLYVRFVSKTIGSSKPFAEATRIDFEEREHEYDETIMDEVANLDEVLVVKSYKELEALLFELEPEDVAEEGVEEDPEEESTPRKRKSARKPKRQEPEEEEEDPEVEEEPEDEPAPRKRKSVRKPKKEEPEDEPEEEEEDPEEEEEEEPAPKPKRTVRKKKEVADKPKRTVRKTKTEPEEEDEDPEEGPEEECPFDHEFGVDTDDYDDCYDCDLWDACNDAKMASA